MAVQADAVIVLFMIIVIVMKNIKIQFFLQMIFFYFVGVILHSK